MAFNLTLDTTGLKEAQQAIEGFSERRLNAAIATALTRTVVAIGAAEKAEMGRVFDRPTAYTLGAVGVKTATAQSLVAEVFLKDAGSQGRPASTYLKPEILGGQRAQQGFERKLQGLGALPQGWRVVPGAGAQLDAFGNFARTQMTAILRDLALSRSVGPQPKNFARKRIGQARRAGGTFFAITTATRGLKPGIYAREFGERNVTPVWVFVRSATYSVRFDFYAVAQRVAQAELGQQIDRAFNDTLGRLLAKGA